MRLFAVSAILFALLTLSGCDQPHDSQPAPAPAPVNRPGVEVHAPGVDVRTDDNGTRVKAPATDVHVEKQPPEKIPESNR